MSSPSNTPLESSLPTVLSAAPPSSLKYTTPPAMQSEPQDVHLLGSQSSPNPSQSTEGINEMPIQQADGVGDGQVLAYTAHQNGNASAFPSPPKASTSQTHELPSNSSSQPPHPSSSEENSGHAQIVPNSIPPPPSSQCDSSQRGQLKAAMCFLGGQF